MDENYLDNLLNEFSLDKEIDHNIEDELDEEISAEKRRRMEAQSVSHEDAFNMDLEYDANAIESDLDLDFSEDQIDELDRLDNLADLDIGDMDFSDIDFDDIDITKLGASLPDDFDDLLKDFDGDFEIPDFSFEDKDVESDEDSVDDNSNYDDTNTYNTTGDDLSVEDNRNDSDDRFEQETDIGVNDDNTAEDDFESGVSSNDGAGNTADGDLNVDSFDADSFLDSLLEDDDIDGAEPQKDDVPENINGELTEDEQSETGPDEDGNQDSLDDLLGDDVSVSSGENSALNESDEMQPLGDDDDLFSMLNLDDQLSSISENLESSDGSGEDASLDMQDNISSEADGEIKDESGEPSDDVPDKAKKKKRTFMEILFGEPDEDDIETEEEIQAREAKKAEKAAKKEAAKAAKAEKAEKAKAKKSLDDAKKKKDDAEKKRIKAEKKAKKKAEDAANAEPEKKLNKPMVIFIFSVFLGGVGFLYLSSVDFNYKLAIRQAADYFASQKYRKAYDEIKGVEVKEKDEELKERIYTVMYVERLYESYENNIQLGRHKKALDSLLRGVTKYYEYYDEAKELDIVSDLDYSFAQIQEALQNNYNISVERAMEINDLSDYDYTKTIEQYTEGMSEE